MELHRLGPTPAGPDVNNLLILSQESQQLLEVSRTGTVLSSLDLSALPGDSEGVTTDPAGTIYLVGETPELYVFNVPEPTIAALLGGLALFLRRRR